MATLSGRVLFYRGIERRRDAFDSAGAGYRQRVGLIVLQNVSSSRRVGYGLSGRTAASFPEGEIIAEKPGQTATLVKAGAQMPHPAAY